MVIMQKLRSGDKNRENSKWKIENKKKNPRIASGACIFHRSGSS